VSEDHQLHPIAGGKLVHLTDATRLLTAAATPREAVGAA